VNMIPKSGHRFSGRPCSNKVKMRLSLSPNEFEGAFVAMANKHVDAVAIIEDAVFLPNPRVIADLASKNRLPSAGSAEFAQAGGLIGYGVHRLELFRRAACRGDRGASER
jgi:putative ABC transport system substrate-binding protein